MTQIHFFLKGDGIAERNWPSVPRVGEMVMLGDSPEVTYEVVEIYWAEWKDQPTARVHVKVKSPKKIRVS